MENVSIVKDNQTKLNENMAIIKSKNGMPLIKLDGFYLNSKYNPLRESMQLAERYYKKNYTHVLFGLAYSYLAKEILKKMGENDFLLIIEPSVKLFDLVKSQGALTPLLDHRQVFFIVGYEKNQVEEEIRYLVNTKNIGQLEFITSPNYEKLYPDLLKHLKEETVKNVRLSLVNIATMIKYGKPWHENLLHNIYDSWTSIPFKEFENRFDCPVIIVASGPSLNKQLESLKELLKKQSALIIAAGSTINPLLNAGIKPHLVVSIDGGEANWRHFKGLYYDDVPIFYSLNVHKDIPKHHNGLKVVFNSEDRELSNWINKITGEDLGFVHGGASVANYSFYIAKTISTGPICFVGQDLSYTNNFSHAAGNKNLTTISKNETKNKTKYVEIKGYYGEIVLSDFSFLSMKKVFEDMVVLFRKFGDNRPIYNCTEGGAYIEGIDNFIFNDFIGEYCNKSYRKEFNNAFKKNEKKLSKKEYIMASFEEEKKNLQKLIRIIKSAIKIIESISQESEFTDSKMLKRLNSIDKKINNYSKSNIIYYLIMPLSFRVNHMYQESENESPIEKKRRILRKSDALYKGILESTEYSLEILNIIENDINKGG